jgi:hypothetical protein
MTATGNSCFLLVDLKKNFSSETARQNEPKLGRKHIDDHDKRTTDDRRQEIRKITIVYF